MPWPRRALALLALIASLAAAAACRSARQPENARRVVLVGLDGADWQLLDGYMKTGAMPQLARLAAEGRRGVLVTEQPPLSPLVWTTMMTGRGPLEHHILDFTRRAPGPGAREPITSDERRVPALWNMADQRGLRSAVLGMWATYPAEAVRGVIVSDRLFSFQQGASTASGIVSPIEREGWARTALAATENENGYEEVHAIVPALDRAEYDRLAAAPDLWAHPVTALRRILVETRVYERLALDLLRDDPPELAILYIQGTDAIGHVFAPYAPPRAPAIAEADFERYSGVPEAYFRRIDVLLGAVRDAAEQSGATLLIVSDHGFKWREGRPTTSSVGVATAGQWHREEGIYLLWGRDVTADASAGRGGVAQVCATALALLGLPPGRGVAGPPLAGVPASSLTAVDYDAGYHVPRAAAAAAPAAEQVEKLRALGYIGADKAGPPGGTDATRTAASYNNEGLILAAQGHAREARAAFEHALAVDPSMSSARWNLSERLWADGDHARADAILIEALDGSSESGTRLRGRVRAHTAAGDADGGRALVERAVAARPKDAAIRLLRGRASLDAQDCRAAAKDFEAAAQSQPGDPVAHASLGLARLCLGDDAGAKRAFERSLALDPVQPEVRKYLEAGR